MVRKLYENKNRTTYQEIGINVFNIQNQLVESVIELCSINSIKSDSQINAPYGVNISKALLKALEISERLGFKTVNIDNQMGYAYFGESEDYYCAIGHVDVVDIKDEVWISPPFKPTIRDGNIYARGALDNKGPILSCLYALYVLKEMGFKPKKQIRIIFGTDEESGFNDLKYYLTKEKPPIFGFTPDCKFPVVYAEQGRAVFKLEFNNEIEYNKTLEVLGSKDALNYLGIDIYDDIFKSNTIKKVTSIEYLKIEIIVSYIPITNINDIINSINNKKHDFNLILVSNYNPVFFDTNNKYVEALTMSFSDVLGFRLEPVETKGGTYAKLMPNILPFGPSFNGQRDIAHLPNEWLNLNDLQMMCMIYAKAFYKIGEIM